MNFGFILSLVIAILAVVSVFIDIPVVSSFSFWIAIVAYVVLAGSR